MLLLCAAALATTPGPAAAQPGPVVLPRATSAVLASINRIRATHGLRRLGRATSLDRAAQAHGISMGRIGYFSHSSAHGQDVRHRLLAYSPGTDLVGEVLYWTSGGSSRAATRAWLRSPPHRTDLLSSRWHVAGVAVVYAQHAPGVFGGRNVTLVVADFGSGR